MKFLLATLGVVFLGGCVSSPFAINTIEPKSVYRIEQVTFTSPAEKEWSLMNNGIHSLILAKRMEDRGESVLLSGTIYQVGLKKNSKEFLEFVIDQKKKNDDKDRFKILSVKNEFLTFKDLPCFKYQTLSEDHGTEGGAVFKYFKTLGYVCRYPLEYIALQMEVSHRSSVKEIPAHLLKVAQKFFDEAQLVEPTIKRLKKIP